MNWHRYLTWRIHRTGFTGLVATLLLILLLPLLSGGAAPSDPSTLTLRNPASNLSDFVFQREGIPGEITVGYQRADQLRALADYLNWLRQERSLIRSDDPDGGLQRYDNYLARVEELHLFRLSEANGLVDQSAWYYGRYAPYWLAIQSDALFSGFFGEGYLTMPYVAPWQPKNDRSFLKETSWTEYAVLLSDSGDPFLIAQSRNLWRQLPLTPQDSASHRLLDMIRSSRFLLVLLPLAAFWILVSIPDRNQRNSPTDLTWRRGLVVFLVSAAGLLLMRLVWYAILRLLLGDQAGAMDIVPAWIPGEASGETTIMSLQSCLLWIMVLDTAFLLFWSALILLLFQLLARTDLVILAASVIALVPYPLIHLPWTAWNPATHLGYLHWNLAPRQFGGQLDSVMLGGYPAFPFLQMPLPQLFSFFGLTLSCLLLTWLVQLIRQNIRRWRLRPPGKQIFASSEGGAYARK